MKIYVDYEQDMKENIVHWCRNSEPRKLAEHTEERGKSS